jgi:hypothetical protein
MRTLHTSDYPDPKKGSSPLSLHNLQNDLNAFDRVLDKCYHKRIKSIMRRKHPRMGTANYANYTKRKPISAVRRGGPTWPPAIVIPAEAGIH